MRSYSYFVGKTTAKGKFPRGLVMATRPEGSQLTTPIRSVRVKRRCRAYTYRFKLSLDESNCLAFLRVQVGDDHGLKDLPGVGWDWRSVAKDIFQEVRNALDGELGFSSMHRIAEKNTCSVERVHLLLTLMESKKIRFLRMEFFEEINGKKVHISENDVTELVRHEKEGVPGAKERMNKIKVAWVRTPTLDE